jgi:hypothetical protein
MEVVREFSARYCSKTVFVSSSLQISLLRRSHNFQGIESQVSKDLYICRYFCCIKLSRCIRQGQTLLSHGLLLLKQILEYIFQNCAVIYSYKIAAKEITVYSSGISSNFALILIWFPVWIIRILLTRCNSSSCTSTVFSRNRLGQSCTLQPCSCARVVWFDTEYKCSFVKRTRGQVFHSAMHCNIDSTRAIVYYFLRTDHKEVQIWCRF